MSDLREGSDTEYRIDPDKGLIWLLVSSKGSVDTIRILGTATERTISHGTWITWDRWTR